jgi:hypothetical protein
MTKETKAAFQWDPNADQTYNGPAILKLPGLAASFNKAQGKSFTMEAPGQTLTLEITDKEGTTNWGNSGGSGGTPTSINVRRGNLIYDASRAPGAESNIGFANPAILTVENDAQFIATGGASTNSGDGLNLGDTAGTLTINVTNNALVEISCVALQFEAISLNVTVAQMARMSVGCFDGFYLNTGTFSVSSSPDAGYSLSWAVGAGESGLMQLANTFVGFIGGSSGLLKAPALTLDRGTFIRTDDTSTCTLQFDSFTLQGNPPRGTARFILGPGKARIQIDSYSDGALPFDFIKNDYPEGMFNIVSDGTINGGEFVIRVSSAFQANAIWSKKLVAIDGVVQSELGRINVTHDAGYATIKQIKI